MSKGRNGSGASSEGVPSEPRLMTVVVKSTTDVQDFQVPEESTVEQLKEQVAPHFETSKDHMLLIFAGKILGDQETLRQHGIRDGLTVHLVLRKPEALKAHALHAQPVVPGCSALALPGSHAPLRRISNTPTLLEGARKDLAALLVVLSELPQHFQAHPELMHDVVQSPTVQSIISSGSCGPLAITCVLAVATLIGLSALQPKGRKEEVASAREIAQALGATGAQDVLVHTMEMAHFLSETPELQRFAQDTPQFSRMMSPSGLTRLMGIYKKLPHLRNVLNAERDGSLTGDLLDEVRSFHQLIADISQVLSSPETQEELEERMLRHVIMTNTSLQELAQKNIMIRHLLSNPQVVEQIVKYIRSPEVRSEMDRHCDRTLKNLENVPGGYNILHHVYTEVEEPIWHIMEEQHKGTLFAPLMGGSPDLGGHHLPPCMENRSPLPDPWAPRLGTSPPRTRKSNGKRSGAAEEGSPSLPYEPGRPFMALDLGKGSRASPPPGVPMVCLAPDVQASPSSSSSSSSSQDVEQDQDLIQEHAAGIGSEVHEEPQEARVSLALADNLEGLMEAEDRHSTTTNAPAGPEPSSKQ